MGRDGVIVSSLAGSYEGSPDGLRWTFAPRRGAHFHDGSVLDAADVLRHVVPNVAGVLAVQAASTAATFLLVEASLS